MIYRFSNRRRAKDAIMQVAQAHGTGNMLVFVRQELVWIDVNGKNIDADTLAAIMYYADALDMDISDAMILDEITELYRESGVEKFRV